MKKFIFGITAIVIAFAVWMSFRNKDVAADGPVQKASEKKVTKASLQRVSDMVWALGLTDSIDEGNPAELWRWRDRCENAMLLYYDSVNPGNQMAKEKKADSVLDEIEASIPEEDTTSGMIQHSLKLYSTLMLRVELYTRRILQSDSSFTEEIKAWNELYSSLSNFCIGVVHLEWFGGSGAGPMMGAARNGVLDVRAKDLHRIIQLGGGSDPASDEMVDYKKTALLDAVNKRASSVSMPAEVKDSYGKEQLQRYRTLYKDIMNSRGKLPDALDKWLKMRDMYKGSSAAALDDMTDVVGFSPTSPEEESEEVEIDKNSPYSYDENQTESFLKAVAGNTERPTVGGPSEISWKNRVATVPKTSCSRKWKLHLIKILVKVLHTFIL